eukprot:gnl/MRDRNA2_/MRDRNA2_64596_c0_seq1.p1 gnl/MRDRNA2_/MRDRNA2_64596_c0~~gnl/MRDRNA2_/MRDRNA2_64596_c0_seq1.p1  ORF type:complete len:464 (+),score=74.66 gnl/MRDRNA2_/MRDRNA2_64596_c0_seq1:63-1454(+)
MLWVTPILFLALAVQCKKGSGTQRRSSNQQEFKEEVEEVHDISSHFLTESHQPPSASTSVMASPTYGPVSPADVLRKTPPYPNDAPVSPSYMSTKTPSSHVARGELPLPPLAAKPAASPSTPLESPFTPLRKQPVKERLSAGSWSKVDKGFASAPDEASAVEGLPRSPGEKKSILSNNVRRAGSYMNPTVSSNEKKITTHTRGSPVSPGVAAAQAKLESAKAKLEAAQAEMAQRTPTKKSFNFTRRVSYMDHTQSSMQRSGSMEDLGDSMAKMSVTPGEAAKRAVVAAAAKLEAVQAEITEARAAAEALEAETKRFAASRGFPEIHSNGIAMIKRAWAKVARLESRAAADAALVSNYEKERNGSFPSSQETPERQTTSRWSSYMAPTSSSASKYKSPQSPESQRESPQWISIRTAGNIATAPLLFLFAGSGVTFVVLWSRRDAAILDKEPLLETCRPSSACCL